MRYFPIGAAAIAAALLMHQDALAESFSERWSALARKSQASVDAVAVAMPQIAKVKKTESRRFKYSRRHRVRAGRGMRHREWYKGGKRWHYVYSRRR